MKKHAKTAVILGIIVLLISSTVFGQQRVRPSSEEKKPVQSDFFINIATSGIGIGYKRHYPFRNEDTKFSLGLELSGIRGEDNVPFFDPISGRLIRGQNSFFSFVIPFTAAIKKRLWREKIEDSFRPFIIAEVGPVLGVAFPTDNDFSDNVGKGQGRVTGRAFLGIGVELGDQTKRSFGLTFGVHAMEFFKKLGEKKSYNGIDIRINFLSN